MIPGLNLIVNKQLNIVIYESLDNGSSAVVAIV